MCKKAGRKINVLARLSAHLYINSKLTLFYAFVLSHFQYCSSILTFCSDSDSRKIEQIQKRALRYIYRDFNSEYDTLRIKADIPLMYVQRLRKLMIDMYGILNGSSPSYLNTMFMPVSSKYDKRDDRPNIAVSPWDKVNRK